MSPGTLKLSRHIAYERIALEEAIEMGDKVSMQQPAVDDVEDQDTRSLSSEDKQVMAQMGKRQQLKVGTTSHFLSSSSSALNPSP